MGRHQRYVGSCFKVDGSTLASGNPLVLIYELIEQYEPDVYMLNKMTWNYNNIYFMRHKVNQLMFAGSVTTVWSDEKRGTVYRVVKKSGACPLHI